MEVEFFLLRLLQRIVETDNVDSSSHCAEIIKNSIYGVDISPYAVESAKFVLLVEVIRSECGHEVDYGKLLRYLNKNIICADSTMPETIFQKHNYFPKSFNCILGNPPYVSSMQVNGLSDRSNLFIPFVDNLIDYSREESCCSLILPLSFSYSNFSDFKRIRKRIMKDEASWRFEQYDRSPDSLFGDDVKSRNCIVVRSKKNKIKQIESTNLLRWTSVNRENFIFSEKVTSNISGFSIEQFVPKLGSAVEVEAYKKLVNNKYSLARMVLGSENNEGFYFTIGGTAYNWLCVYDHVPNATDSYGNPYVSSSRKKFTTINEDDLYFVIACLNSVCAFWLWTVVGDGFHITNRILTSFGIEKNLFDEKSYDELVALGRKFSREIINYPTKSVNSGKIITSYNHLHLMDIIYKIDKVIADGLFFINRVSLIFT